MEINSIMKLIILPGNSSSNMEWADSARRSFSNSFTDIYVQNYSHWDTGKEFIDFDIELEKLVGSVRGDDCMILAKSAGAMLTIYGVHKNKFHPEKCVFLGLPIRFAIENNFALDQWLKNYDVPTIIMQNSNDPVTSFTELKSALADVQKTNIQLIEIEGDTHSYDDFKLIKKKAKVFLL